MAKLRIGEVIKLTYAHPVLSLHVGAPLRLRLVVAEMAGAVMARAVMSERSQAAIAFASKTDPFSSNTTCLHTIGASIISSLDISLAHVTQLIAHHPIVIFYVSVDLTAHLTVSSNSATTA
jgi:hypothetical protein